MQEHGHDEAPPLVWLVAAIFEVLHVGLVGYSAHAAKLTQRAGQAARVDGSGVGAGP